MKQHGIRKFQLLYVCTEIGVPIDSIKKFLQSWYKCMETLEDFEKYLLHARRGR